MKKLSIILQAICMLLMVNVYAQSGEATTEAFQLDFTTPADMEIIWEFPTKSDTLVEEKEIVLRLGYNTNHEIKNISLLLNGIPINSENRGVAFNKVHNSNYDVFIKETITLHDGGNVLKFTMRDKNGNIKSTERSIVYKPKVLPVAVRNDYALLFATDNYDEWGDLTNPVNDARTIAEELEKNYGFKVELVEDFKQDEVIIKLREYAKKNYGELDQLFIFFAGHGQYDELLGQGYIVSQDSRLRDEAKSSYISHSVLRNAIDNIPNEHILLAMDVCFGGTFDPVIARSGSRGQDDLYNEVGLNEYINRRLRFKTRKYITSGGKQYVPDGRPGMHSPFASKLLEGFRSYGGRDNIITLPELIGWLERINPEPRSGGFGTNEPGSDFVFVVKE